jgi:L-lactate dehydrogenase
MSRTGGAGTVAIVGVGDVGATTAFALLTRGVVSEIVLVDVDEAKAEGEAMDLNHGAYFTPPTTVRTGDYADCHDADVVIVAAGAAQAPGESRLDLAEKNAGIFAEAIPAVTEGMDDGVLVPVTNPVDVLSQVAWEASDLPASRVVGSGTVLDTSRFRHVLARECGVDPGNVHAYVLGEHGDSEVLAWSRTSISGASLTEFVARHRGPSTPAEREAIERRVREAAYEIIERKGATYYAVALAVAEIVEAICRDERSILTVSTLLNDVYGVSDVYASVPCVVGREGVREVVEFDLVDEERAAFRESAAVIRERRAALDLGLDRDGNPA